MWKSLALLCFVGVSFAQNRIIGEVTGKTGDQITVKTDAGATENVPVTPETKLLKVPPGESSLAKASSITFDDLSTGDRVLVRPNQIIVMSRGDLQQKQAAEHTDWQKRGAAGRVTATTADTITVANATGQTVTVAVTPKTTFRRYSADSVRFSDAKTSSLSEVKAGDQLRVLGDRNGDKITAEVVVSGAFRNLAGTVVSVDANAGEIKLTDLETKKPVTVKVNSGSVVRKLPPMMAQMMAARRGGEVPAGQTQPTRAPRDFGQMLERMPAVNLSELKAGDALIVASTAGTDPSRATAIAVVAGVEPLLTGPPSDRRLNGPWNFDINMAP